MKGNNLTEVRLYDSATRRVRSFVPLVPGKVGIYDCGPTVYDWQHIGNLYRYVISDVVRRSFEYVGYDVHQVMNITDVGHLFDDADEGEDKMETAARREGKDPTAIAARYTEQFIVDRRKLNILDPHEMPYATGHIPLMIDLIQRLLASGHAYVAPDGVYFDTTTFPGYGKRLNVEAPDERRAGARVEVNENKRHPFDFALWRAAKPGDLQQWDSPWGRGNPGWHVECSAMSMRYLGDTFDIHSGGEDHLFPHHECEIAQSESATGKEFVRYWMHVHFLRIESGGMHKSVGNVYLLSDLERWGFDPLAFRFLSLGVSYRKGVDFTREGLEQAQRRLERWRAALSEAYQSVGDELPTLGEDPIQEAFVAELADDFNTPRALAQAENALALVNSSDRDSRRRGLALVFDMDRVLGLSLRNSAEATSDLSREESELLRARDAARAAGDYARSDELRMELGRRHGIRVKDTKEGTRWERVARKGA